MPLPNLDSRQTAPPVPARPDEVETQVVLPGLGARSLTKRILIFVLVASEITFMSWMMFVVFNAGLR